METKKVREGLAPTFGWLRRPELDNKRYDVWEAPDGGLYGYLNKGDVPYLRNGEICEKPGSTPTRTN